MEYLHGGDIYSDGKIRLDFSVNTSPLGMPESIRQAVINSSGSWERYPDSRSRSLKSALADYYGGRIPKDAFICGNGSADLMYTLIFALRPERALVPVPAFAEYQMALGAGGCLAKPILLEESTGFSLEKNKEKLMEHIRKSSGIDMMMLGNPVNPCGSAAGREWIEEMAGLCREKEIFLVIDECFNWFLKERQHFSAIPLITEEPEKYRHVMVINAFTKIYAMAGLRFGYAVCTDREVIRRMERCRQPWSVSAPAEAAAMAALTVRGEAEKTAELVETERCFLTENLAGLGFTVYPSMVNYLLFRADTDFDYRAFCRERGILIRSCGNFEGLDGRYYRVTVKQRKENRELLKCLKEASAHERKQSQGNGELWQKQL
ncbi:histidinol-phosphate transaminase [uncultured Clostridium sp.]|uniref:pyridoxal phosphate-dependent aminotransferase n=1 Tax=uncultured Clostridium sp. TaxID=59620 RepID=UPI0025FFECA0|nr:histidinol-phosphate transaminase [uncultured Clostridium sp.]